MVEYTAEHVLNRLHAMQGHALTVAERAQLFGFARDYAALLRERESAKESDDELPGMWSAADFIGGDPDERSYAERESAQKLVTDEIVEHVQYSLDNHPDNRTYAEQVSAASVRAALEAVAPMLASARVLGGWKLVPVEATDEMCEAAWESDASDYVGEHRRIHRADLAYKAMLAAAPKPETEE